MENCIINIINQGDDNGNEMVVKFRLPSGLEIYGLPTKNFYGGHWDLGPTWNYAVMANTPFLVDAGRFGQGKNLVGMMETAGIKSGDLDFVLISHSHEDHDGGLAELVETSRLKVKAHAVYDLLIRQYPEKAPSATRERFPAKCWHCPMPESFWSKNCLGYHRVLQDLQVDSIGDGENYLASDIRSYHLPGHSPDCLAVLLGDEAIIVGDIVLPDISPWPTRQALFAEVAEIIEPGYTEPEAIFGLQRYIKSLKKLGEISHQHPEIIVLPAHRLYYGNRWNGIDLAARVNELLQHHIDRCAAILEILSGSPKTAEETAREHFDEKLLEGFGGLMAANEVISHCELLIACGDVTAIEANKYAASGNSNFRSFIESLRSDY
ncbi:MAG: MBL fold metallo-hydrolase [Desulfobacterales bacterium]|nr:MAG: MBL fold metallo-hydrolase [Desulfobacterales bacterium]